MAIKKMKIISIIWGLLLFAIVAILTVFGFKYKKLISKYEKVEEKLTEATKQYVDKRFLYPEKNESLKVTLEELQGENILASLQSEDSDECNGYTIIKNKNGIFNYDSYIKCDKYKTKNYEKN